MGKLREHIYRRCAAAAPRAAVLAIVTCALCAVLGVLHATLHTVTVRDSDGVVRVVRSAYHEPAELLRVTGMTPGPNDTVAVAAMARMAGSGAPEEIFVQRAYPVTVTADGETYTLEASAGTVAQLLARAGIAVGENDRVSPSPDTAVSPDMGQVRVVRVTFEETTHETVVPFTVEQRDDTEVTQGQYIHEELAQEGQDGVRVTTRRRIYEDGRYVRTQTVRDEMRTPMLPEIHRTYRTDALSTVPAPPGVTVENNVPTGYSVMLSMRSTGYWSPAGRGASGLGLYLGTFACDPTLIPYGTKAYVTSEDGSFVYGWAIATDTGAFIYQNRMQIDLFYESFEASAAHGVRQVNVYLYPGEGQEIDVPEI